MDSVDDLIDRSTIAGQISPFLKKFVLTKAQLEYIWSGITHHVSIRNQIYEVMCWREEKQELKRRMKDDDTKSNL